MKGLWSIMLSRKQNAVHVERLQDTIEASWRQIRGNLYNDYILIEVTKSQVVAEHLAKYARKLLKKEGVIE